MNEINRYDKPHRSPGLRFSLRVDVVVALGGLALIPDRRNAARHRILWYFLMETVGGLMYGTIAGRYRLPIAAVLLVYAAFAVVWLGRQVAAGRWRTAAIAALTALAIGFVSENLLPSVDRQLRYRPDEFFM